jgi:hypothetical protein
MGDLFKYMSAAYERLEKETKDALQAESHSSAFSDACTEYFGQNFEKTQDPERLSKLLYNLHETNAHILLMRLAGGQHIEDTIETDKKALSKRTTSGAELTLALFKDTESQVEQEPAPTLTKGKNYINNKKRAERKKRQRATVAENGEVEGVADPSESLKETMDNSAASAEHHDESILEGENVGHISQDCKKFSIPKYFHKTN